MPSFEALIISPPSSFIQSCKNVNKLVDEDEDSCRTWITLAVADARTISKTNKDVKGAQIDVNIVVRYILSAITTTAPGSDFSAIPPSKLASILDSYSFLSRKAIEHIVLGITGKKHQSAEESIVVPQILSRRLQNLQWKSGIALSSSTCKTLLAPYVALTFDVIDQNNRVTSHSMELSYPQFQEMRKTFQKISSVMERL